MRPRERLWPELPAAVVDGCRTLEGSANSGPPGVSCTAASAPQALLATGIVVAAAPPAAPVEVPEMVAVRLGEEEPPLDSAWCSACWEERNCGDAMYTPALPEPRAAVDIVGSA